MSEKIKVVFVCLGNICRSPAAEGAFRNLVEKKGLSDLFEIDSAGTADYHVGETPHETTTQVARQRKKVVKFRRFDANVKGEPDVPDPYYDGIAGFEHVQDIVERSSIGFLEWILENQHITIQDLEENEE